MRFEPDLVVYKLATSGSQPVNKQFLNIIKIHSKNFVFKYELFT